MTIYTPTARFDTGRAMTEDELRHAAPSIFALTAHESRSERFQPIPTIEVLRALEREGFVAVGAQQCVVRQADRRNFTKHLIRLRRVDDDSRYRVGDTICEMLLKNANDGSSAYDLMAGLFKIQCLNSLVSQTATLDTVKVRHSGDVQHKVIEGTYQVLEVAQQCLEAPISWSQIEVKRDEAMAFAQAAHVLRFGDNQGIVKTPIEADQLLRPRRNVDVAPTLWNTFNVVQENAIRGGLHGQGRDAQNRRRNVTSRAIKGIDQSVQLNKALWVLTQEMARLKGGTVI